MLAEEIFKKYEAKEENLLYILHDIQNSSNTKSLSKDDLRGVAEYLSVPLSRVDGVVGFYSMFSKKERGNYIIRLCQSPPCFIKGSCNVQEILENYLGIKENETTADGLFTLEFSSCLGVCGLAPAMMINEDVFGNLDKEKIIEILNKYQSLED